MGEEKKLSTKRLREKLHDEMTAVVKDIVAKAKATQDAKTAKLRKLRAARDKAAAKKKPGKKRKR